VDPTGRFLILANGGNGDILQQTINQQTGVLSTNGSIVGIGNSTAVAFEPRGQFMYSADASNFVDMFSVSSTGTLGNLGTIAAGSSTIFVAVDPSGQYVYAANTGSGNVSAYQTQSNGTLVSLGNANCGTSPNGLAISPDSRFLYVAEGGGTVCIMSINGGALASVNTAQAGTTPKAVMISPGGRNVYVANSGSNDVYVYNRNSVSGALTKTGQVTVISPLSLAGTAAFDF